MKYEHTILLKNRYKVCNKQIMILEGGQWVPYGSSFKSRKKAVREMQDLRQQQKGKR